MPPYDKYVYDIQYLKDRYFDIPEKIAAISHLRAGLILGVTTPMSGDPLLDVGYGTGGFLGVIQKYRVRACGVEVIDYPVPDGCYAISDQEMRYCHWHTVTFFDSVEHTIPHYLAILNTTYVVITAPWCHEAPGTEWFHNWKHRRYDEHLSHFNPDSLRSMLSEYKYEEVWRGNPEDIVRGTLDGRENTFTAIFKKILFTGNEVRV